MNVGHKRMDGAGLSLYDMVDGVMQAWREFNNKPEQIAEMIFVGKRGKSKRAQNIKVDLKTTTNIRSPKLADSLDSALTELQLGNPLDAVETINDVIGQLRASA